MALAAGGVLGFLWGLGVGGGSLLMLWLTQVVGVAQGTARLMNLMFFLPAALGSCLIRVKKGSIPWKLWLQAVIPATVATWLCAGFAARLDTELLRKCFGGLLILVGLWEILGRKKGAR